MGFIKKMFNPPEKSGWEEYLFREHSEDFLAHWTRRLKLFRFFRAIGGQANDADKIELALSYDGQEDLRSLLDDLRVPYKQYSEKPPQPEIGKSYPGNEFVKFPSLIPGTTWIEQPGRQRMKGIEVSIWGIKEKVYFSIIGSPDNHWDITETEFKNAELLESEFAEHSHRIIDPPFDSRNFICPKYYPHYWKD